jgi:hypothetical protein
MEEMDIDWWLDQTPEDRLGWVFDMWDEQAVVTGGSNDEASSRLQRSVGGVRPRRR